MTENNSFGLAQGRPGRVRGPSRLRRSALRLAFVVKASFCIPTDMGRADRYVSTAGLVKAEGGIGAVGMFITPRSLEFTGVGRMVGKGQS